MTTLNSAKNIKLFTITLVHYLKIYMKVYISISEYILIARETKTVVLKYANMASELNEKPTEKKQAKNVKCSEKKTCNTLAATLSANILV